MTEALEVWARNPHSYIKECLETNTRLIAWDRGILKKFKVDPYLHGVSHFTQSGFRSLAIGDQGAAEVDETHTMHNPKGVYPVWEYNQMSLDQLEAWMAKDHTAELRDRALELNRPPDEVPVLGQEHRVVVTHLPDMTTGVGLKFLSTLGLMQLDYPSCILHIHGLTTFRWMSSGIRSGDLDLRYAASKGAVLLPSGKLIKQEDSPDHIRWVSLLGWKPSDLKVPRNRCMFSIQAAHWAAQHWPRDPHLAATPRMIATEEFVKVLNGAVELDYNETSRFSVTTGYSTEKKPVPLVGDRFYCEACSLAPKCRAFRVGSICSVPDSEATDLSQYFKTRDSGVIIEGLGRLMEGGIQRLYEGREAELSKGELDPHVTKMHAELFRQGTNLAKLVDPKLRSAAVAIQMNSGNGVQVTSGGATAPTLQTRVSEAMEALEGAGVPLSMITEEMIERCIALGTDQETLRQIVVEEATKFQLPSGLVDDDEEIVEL